MNISFTTRERNGVAGVSIIILVDILLYKNIFSIFFLLSTNSAVGKVLIVLFGKFLTILFKTLQQFIPLLISLLFWDIGAY